MEARAVAHYIRMAPRKVRQVADMVRGRSVEEAINLLHFTPKRGSLPVEKVLRSAVANAMNKEENSKLEPEDLFIKTIYVDQGPTMRRYNPGPMGRANLIRKRFCHITVIVSDKQVMQ
jgi:large subunit ribosomal protein L22